MEFLNEIRDFYLCKGIQTGFYNHEKNQEPIGLYALIGIDGIRALHFGNLRNKEYSYRRNLLERVLSLLYLSDYYPWVIYTEDTMTVFFRCDCSEKIHNTTHLLWHTRIALPSIRPNVFFYHSEFPEVCPYWLDYSLIQHCLDTIQDEMQSPIDHTLGEYKQMVCHNAPYTIYKCWPLKNFLREYNQVRFSHEYYSVTEDIQPVCIFRRRDGKVLTVYNFNNYSLSEIKKNYVNLHIELKESGHYILCEAPTVDSHGLVQPLKPISYWEDYERAEEEKGIQDWADYYKMMDEESLREAKQKNQEELRKAALKRSDEFLYDFSGDDLSLDPSMW